MQIKKKIDLVTKKKYYTLSLLYKDNATNTNGKTVRLLYLCVLVFTFVDINTK